MKELTKRTLMALWGIPLILGVSYLGNIFFLIFIMIIHGMALWEFYTMFQNQNVYAYRITAVSISTLLILSTYWLPEDILIFSFMGMSIILLLRHLIKSAPNTSINTIITFGGLLYITIFSIALLKVRLNFEDWMSYHQPEYAGGRFLVLLWISIWICDTFAYFGGRLMGKHKLAPNTSPNKTVEGAIWGLIGSLLIFLIGGPLILKDMPPYFWWIASLFVGIFGQWGDLVESRFKRDAGVKDTSTLLPGHGGFLDRFDSILFVSPFFYIYFVLINL